MYRKGSDFSNLIENYLSNLGVHPRVTMRLDQADTVMAMLRAGLGIGFLQSWTVEAELRAGSLERISQAESPLQMRLCLVRRKSGYVSKAVKGFLEMAREWDEVQQT